jgi:uncharacterized protein DUF899
MVPVPSFETTRLILKPLSLEDVPSYQTHFVDYEVIRHLSAVVPWPYIQGTVSVNSFERRFFLAEIEAFKQRMGWRIPWVSSFGSDFNFDYQVSFTKEEIAKGNAYHNYKMQKVKIEEMSGMSVFYKNVIRKRIWEIQGAETVEDYCRYRMFFPAEFDHMLASSGFYVHGIWDNKHLSDSDLHGVTLYVAATFDSGRSKFGVPIRS